ncbi:hypothetical protein HA50_23235 [Pantoea cypripedii]|uniref:Tox-PLDMTX domain-containing protein n=2 Tax=Pantoea cypripedii TaxID=55209 RepID=A0A1X1EKX8_PANCY|nr:hypothetical protein HA50_23235 [Pantoea cypripedii]
MKFQNDTVPPSIVNSIAPADSVRKDSPGTHEDMACVVVLSMGCNVMKQMPESNEESLRLLNDYQKSSPALQESLSKRGFIAANGELDEPYACKNWKALWEIFPAEKFKDLPEGARFTKKAEDLLNSTEVFLQDVMASVEKSLARTDELTGMQPATAEAEAKEEAAVDVQTLRLLLDEETRESVVATANEFIREGGRNREHLDDLGSELKAAVESLDDAQNSKLANPEDRSVLAAAVKVMKDSMEAINKPETAERLSAEEKQVRLDACEALIDLSAALEGAVDILKSIRAAATGSDVLGLPEKLSNARRKIKDALKIVKKRRNESIESTYPDKSGRVKAALLKVSIPGSKKDPVTDVLNNLKAHEQNLEKGVYRERIYIREATQTLSKAVDTLPKGKVRDAVSQLQTFCEFLAPHLKALASGETPTIAGAKELKEAATAAVAMYRTLMSAGNTDEPKTQRDVFNEAVDKLIHAHKSIKSQELKQPLRDTGLAFSLVRENIRSVQSVDIKTDTLTQLKEMSVALRSAGAEAVHKVAGVTEKMGSPGAERKKLTDLLEVKSDPLLTSLHWFVLKGKALAGNAKAADKVADMQVHKKGFDSLSNVSDMRTKSVEAISLARTELKEAFSFVEHRWQETQKTLHALQTTSQNEFTLAKAQLNAMEKDDPRKLPARPEDISQQRKKVNILRKFLSDIQQCHGGFKKAVNEARKAAGSAETLAFSQDRLTKSEVGLPASEALLQAEGAMRKAVTALREVTHREPEVYGPQQRLSIYLALVLAEQVDEIKGLSPAEKHALVEAQAEKLAGEIDSPGFDRKAFAALIKEYYRQKCDGTLKLPRAYREVLAEPGLKWANLMTDKGAARLGSSLVRLTFRKLISQSVNIFVPGGFVGSAWGRVRGVVSAGLILKAGNERVDSLRKGLLPRRGLPSGTLSQAKKDTWKFAAALTVDAAMPQVLRDTKNGLAMLSDIRKNGFAHTMEQANNHFVANNLISSGITLAAAGGREGVGAAAEFITDTMESASLRNQVFPYRGQGDRVEQAVGEIADIARRGRTGPEGMRKDEVAMIDRALDDALKDLAQEKARLNGTLTKAERDFIKERGLTPKDLIAACDAQSERLRSYQTGGENANQLVILGKSKPGQSEFDACVREGDSRIFIREGAAGKDLLRHEVTHLWGKGERETRNITATLMGLRTGDHRMAGKLDINLDANDENNTDGLHFAFGGDSLFSSRKTANISSRPDDTSNDNLDEIPRETRLTRIMQNRALEKSLNSNVRIDVKQPLSKFTNDVLEEAYSSNGISNPDSRIKNDRIKVEVDNSWDLFGLFKSQVFKKKMEEGFTPAEIANGTARKFIEENNTLLRKVAGTGFQITWPADYPDSLKHQLNGGFLLSYMEDRYEKALDSHTNEIRDHLKQNAKASIEFYNITHQNNSPVGMVTEADLNDVTQVIFCGKVVPNLFFHKGYIFSTNPGFEPVSYSKLQREQNISQELRTAINEGLSKKDNVSLRNVGNFRTIRHEVPPYDKEFAIKPGVRGKIDYILTPTLIGNKKSDFDFATWSSFEANVTYGANALQLFLSAYPVWGPAMKITPVVNYGISLLNSVPSLLKASVEDDPQKLGGHIRDALISWVVNMGAGALAKANMDKLSDLAGNAAQEFIRNPQNKAEILASFFKSTASVLTNSGRQGWKSAAEFWNSLTPGGKMFFGRLTGNSAKVVYDKLDKLFTNTEPTVISPTVDSVEDKIAKLPRGGFGSYGEMEDRLNLTFSQYMVKWGGGLHYNDPVPPDIADYIRAH